MGLHGGGKGGRRRESTPRSLGNVRPCRWVTLLPGSQRASPCPWLSCFISSQNAFTKKPTPHGHLNLQAIWTPHTRHAQLFALPTPMHTPVLSRSKRHHHFFRGSCLNCLSPPCHPAQPQSACYIIPPAAMLSLRVGMTVSGPVLLPALQGEVRGLTLLTWLRPQLNSSRPSLCLRLFFQGNPVKKDPILL